MRKWSTVQMYRSRFERYDVVSEAVMHAAVTHSPDEPGHRSVDVVSGLLNSDTG